MDPVLAALLGLALLLAPAVGQSVSFTLPGQGSHSNCPRLLSASTFQACAAIDAVCSLVMRARCFP